MSITCIYRCSICALTGSFGSPVKRSGGLVYLCQTGRVASRPKLRLSKPHDKLLGLKIHQNEIKNNYISTNEPQLDCRHRYPSWNGVLIQIVNAYCWGKNELQSLFGYTTGH